MFVFFIAESWNILLLGYNWTLIIFILFFGLFCKVMLVLTNWEEVSFLRKMEWNLKLPRHEFSWVYSLFMPTLEWCFKLHLTSNLGTKLMSGKLSCIIQVSEKSIPPSTPLPSMHSISSLNHFIERFPGNLYQPPFSSNCHHLHYSFIALFIFLWNKFFGSNYLSYLVM